MIYYTGIGARKTPPKILHTMQRFGEEFARAGFTLRSGAAPGADTAFEQGCNTVGGDKEIYLPWKRFSKHDSPLYDVTDDALELAADIYGPLWKYLKRPVKLLMARNMYQILGKNLDTPSEFVVCWTPDGCTRTSERTKLTGGTGQAIALASDRDIPIFNIYHGYDELQEFIMEILI